MRSLLVLTAMVCVLLTVGGSVLRAEETTVEKLKAFDKEFKAMNRGAKLLKKAVDAEHKVNPTEFTEKLRGYAGKLSSKVGVASKAVNRLYEQVKEDGIEDADDEMEDAGKAFKDYGDDGWGFLKLLKKGRRDLDDIKVGVVTTESHPDLSVSLKLLVEDRDEAIDRLRQLAQASRDNVSRLKKLEESLQAGSKDFKTVGRALHLLSDSLGDLYKYGGGIFEEFLLIKALEIGDLGNACNAIAGDAAAKLKEVESALKEQQTRLNNLVSNARDNLDVKL